MQGIQNILAAQLRIAARLSKFTDEVLQEMRLRNEGSTIVPDASKLYWRTNEDQERIARYEENKNLYFLKHDFMKPTWLPPGRTFYKPHNYCRFITNSFADIIAGNGSTIQTNNAIVDKWLKDRQISDKFYNWLLMCSMMGLIGVQVVVDEEGVDLLLIEPQMLYPVFDDSGEDYVSISKKYEVKVDEVIDPTFRWDFKHKYKGEDKKYQIIFEEQHFKGEIYYFLYVVEGNEIREMLPPSWYDPSLPPLVKGFSKVVTGVDDFMLMIVPNILTCREYVSDYDDVRPFQKSINARATQINRILNIHANPKLMVPDSMQQVDPTTGQTIQRALRDEVLYISADENQVMEPKYLTWDAQLEGAYKELKLDQDAICTFSSISAALLVREGTQYPEAAAAYKLRLTSTINASKRKKNWFTKFAIRILYVYLTKLKEKGLFKVPQTEGIDTSGPDKDDPTMPTLGVQNAIDVMEIKREDITIRMHPALPQDERFMVERVGTGVATVSRERVLFEVDGMSEAEAQEEIRKIEKDEKSSNESFGSIAGGLSYGGGFNGSNDSGLGIGDAVGKERTSISVSSAVT